MVTPPDNSLLYRSAGGYQQVITHYDSALRGMGIPHECQYVQTGFGLTHVIISGQETGRPVALWHGLNANATSWVNWIPALAPRYRIYAIDTIGVMGKSAPTRPPKRAPDYGLWAANVLDGLGLERANMIGASNGGWLILKPGNLAQRRLAALCQ